MASISNSIGIDLKQFYENNKKTIIIILLLIIGFIFFRVWWNNRTERNDLAALVKLQSDSLTTYKDANGLLHSQIHEIQGSEENIKALYGKTIDSLAKALNVKSSQIESYIQVIAQTKGNFKTKVETIVKHDTITKPNGNGDFEFSIVNDTSYKVRFNDKYLSLQGDYNPQTDSVTGSYKFVDSITVASYYKKHGFLGLGSKEWFIDARSTNPATELKGLSNFRVTTEKVKRFGVGPNFTVTYINGKFTPTVGIGVQYSFLRF